MKYDTETCDYGFEDQVCSSISFPCGEVIESWVLSSRIEAAIQIRQWLKENPPVRHRSCKDDWCTDWPLSKHEEYALGHYLSAWPEDWNYHRIIQALECGDGEHDITAFQIYEDLSDQDLAIEIEDMVDSLSRHFMVIK